VRIRPETLRLLFTEATKCPFSVRNVPDTLAEELLLLAHDIRGKCRVIPSAMDRGVAGALLSELALRGRLTTEGPVAVTDASPAGDPVLDDLLVEIAAKPRTPRAWVDHLREAGLTRRLLDRMVESGRVEIDHHRNYGLFAETWYPVRDIVALWDAHQRVVLAATGSVTADRRALALGALAEATGLAKVLFATSGDWRALAERVRESSADDWAAGAVRHAIAAEREGRGASV
jgi:Golgi phosphoprotein 3 (GPP34)